MIFLCVPVPNEGSCNMLECTLKGEENVYTGVVCVVCVVCCVLWVRACLQLQGLRYDRSIPVISDFYCFKRSTSHSRYTVQLRVMSHD